MGFLDHLPPALADFLRTGTGSSNYEHALAWALAAVVCILILVVLL
jgi:hypothetical protein